MAAADIGDGVYDLLINLIATFPNGTSYEETVLASSAVVITGSQGSSGSVLGTGANWTGAPDMSRYTVLIDSPEMGISGKITFQSAAPRHYPCGPVKGGQNMEVLANSGWANAVPDAFTDLDFNIKGSRLAFTGVGYHDKNWADDYLANLFNLISPTGVNSVSAYVSAGERIIAAQCSGIKVRPTGLNDTYPPTATSGFPSGYNMTIDLGEHGVLVAEVVNQETIAQYPGYMRYKGWFSGKLDGKPLPKGVALYEETSNLV